MCCCSSCVLWGDSCVGHDNSAAALLSFGGRGVFTLPAGSFGDAHTEPHCPAESGAAAWDRKLPGSLGTSLTVPAGWIGMWRAHISRYTGSKVKLFLRTYLKTVKMILNGLSLWKVQFIFLRHYPLCDFSVYSKDATTPSFFFLIRA